MKKFSTRISGQMEITLYAAWGILTVLWTIVAFQMQAVLLSIGLVVVKYPALTPYGWSSHTIHGLNRLIIFVVGSLWLGIVVYSEQYLREGCEEGNFFERVKHSLLVIGGTYLASGVLMYLLSLAL